MIEAQQLLERLLPTRTFPGAGSLRQKAPDREMTSTVNQSFSKGSSDLAGVSIPLDRLAFHLRDPAKMLARKCQAFGNVARCGFTSIDEPLRAHCDLPHE